MGNRNHRMATLWEVPDGLWEHIELLLDEADPPQATGEKADLAACSRFFQGRLTLSY